MTKHPAPPAARRIPTTVVLHGERLADDYAWLRDRESPEVRQYLEAENRYAEGVLAPLGGLETRLYDEMLGRIKQTDLSVPYRDGEYWYYTRTEEGRQYGIHCRKLETLDAPEEILLDLNEMAVGQTFMAVAVFAVSPDGRYLAYSTDVTGFREYTLHVKDLATGAAVIEPIPHAGTLAWAADGRTFFHTVEDQTTKRDFRVYRASLDGGPSALVYEELDERFRVVVTRTRSRRFLVLYAASHLTSEARVLEAGNPTGPWRVVIPRVHDREYDLDHHDDRFFVRINDTSRNFRIVTVPVADAGSASWTEVLAPREDVMVEGVECFAGHWVAWERSGGLPRIRITDVRSDQVRYVGFEEEVYEAGPSVNAEWHTHQFRYRYESFVTSPSVYEYDMTTGDSVLLKRKEVLGDYDPSRYQSERLFATAADGTRIPISLVRRRDVAEPAPAYLTGYGAYGIPYPVSFTSNRLSLLDRGVTFAVAHVRGGGELGRRWHDGGRMAQKMNTFTDFIACADYLVASGRTRHDRLAIDGGSAGGLLIGAVVNLRRDLCAAALLEVPFVDVINTMRDATLPLTVGEYEEWGNPEIAEQYRWIREYCPYTNLAAGEYPSILVRTSLNDSQVMYWEPAKYVSRLRTLKTDANPLLLLTNLGAGHGGASGRYDRLREIATDYAFILWRLGLAG
ncbi:MAG: S9 family peptidase [Gemmatimonadales bacterium]|nr:S9 family peptidase [Gemmatimonadales bacterium]